MDDLTEILLSNQLDEIPSNRRLKFRDMQRLAKYLPCDIFDTENCCLWKDSNLDKSPYINFYFNRQKVSIQRLLYENFVGKLSKHEYLKFNCENKGTCCNITHFDFYSQFEF